MTVSQVLSASQGQVSTDDGGQTVGHEDKGHARSSMVSRGCATDRCEPVVSRSLIPASGLIGCYSGDEKIIFAVG